MDARVVEVPHDLDERLGAAMGGHRESPGVLVEGRVAAGVAGEELACLLDRVTIAEVAEAANVSVNTIFNYFSTKEELFFDRAEEVIDEPCRIVRERRPGESVVDALRRSFREAIKKAAGVA